MGVCTPTQKVLQSYPRWKGVDRYMQGMFRVQAKLTGQLVVENIGVRDGG